MKCIRCGHDPAYKNGSVKGVQQYRCSKCGRCFSEGVVGESAKQEQTNQEPKKVTMGLSENELRAKHDVRYQVKQAIKLLKPAVYLTDSEFITMAKIKPGQGYRSVIDHPDFDQYKGKAGSTIYWGYAESIAKLKEEGVLQ